MWSCKNTDAVPVLRISLPNTAALTAGRKAQKLLRQSSSNVRFISRATFLSIKRTGLWGSRRGQVRRADKVNVVICLKTSEMPAEISRLPGADSRGRKAPAQPSRMSSRLKALPDLADCGLFTLWVLPSQLGNFPQLAEPQTRKEKATWVLSLFVLTAS